MDCATNFASTRPSSAAVGAGTTRFDDYKEHHWQQWVISRMNSFLLSRKSPITFESSGSTPFKEDKIKTLTFLLREIGYRVSKFEADLPPILKSLKYPLEFNKSMLKFPGVPHQWPSFLALIHWLVQIASFDPSKSTSNTVLSLVQARLVHQYILNSYLNYIKSHDDVVEELELDFMDKLNHQKALIKEKLEAANNELKSLRDNLERLRLHPVKKEDIVALIPC